MPIEIPSIGIDLPKTPAMIKEDHFLPKVSKWIPKSTQLEKQASKLINKGSVE